MTSDEKDKSWWEQVAKQGWYIIDHSGTVEHYGAWYVHILVTPSRFNITTNPYLQL